MVWIIVKQRGNIKLETLNDFEIVLSNKFLNL